MIDLKKIKIKKNEVNKLACLVMNNNEDNKGVFGIMSLNISKWKKEYTSLYEALINENKNFLLYVLNIEVDTESLTVKDEDIIFKDEIIVQ